MDQEHILIGKVIFWTACLHIFLILSWWGTNFNISGLFITVPILIFKDVHNINHLVYTKQKKVEKIVLIRLKFKAIFFYIYPQSSRTEFY